MRGAVARPNEHSRTDTAGQKFRAVFDQSPIAMAILHPDLTYAHVNEAWTRILGYELGELRGKVPADITHPDDRSTDAPLVEALVNGRLSRYTCEKRYVRRDGSVVHVLLHAAAVVEAGGGERYYIGQVQDVSQRVRAEADLAAERERFRTLVMNAPVGIFEMDADGNVVFTNQEWLALTGLGPQEARTPELRTRGIHPDDRARVTSTWAGARLAGTKYAVSFRYCPSDGPTKRLSSIAAPLRRPDGTTSGFIGVTMDVTAQFDAREAERLASLGTMAAGIAHELNNPLAAVMGNVDFVLRGLHAAKDSSTPLGRDPIVVDDCILALEDASAASERIRKIVRTMRWLVGPPGSGGHLVDLRELSVPALELTESGIRRKARLVLSYGAAPPVRVDESQMVQVLVNLLRNAADAIPEGAADRHEVRLVTGTDDAGRAIVEVEDTGVGIPEAELSRIFDPFFTTKTVGEGVGLGLSVCHSLVTAMGGELAVESRPGRGTTFRVSLPPASEPAEPRR
ncbi:MAG TPA: PAS domain S-box protein [Polyangiaceae bacterium]|nr:PAS domain S-box protein [Polyangiaceae bacterium]